MSALQLQSLRSFVDRTANQTLAEHAIAGVSVSVSYRGNLVFADGRGFANVLSRIPVSASTIFGIGSMTKQFTAVAVMQLAERGRLDLNEPIGSYLPVRSRITSRASIRDVLAHVAGIRGDVERIMLADSRDPQALTRDGALWLVSDDLFDIDPGQIWRYSNFGYYLLGIVIEEISGRTYSEYLWDHVLRPAGLSNTTYGVKLVAPEQFAQGYADDGDGFASVDLPSTEQTFSSGGLFSNILDLQVWTTALQSGQLISRRSYTEMTTPGVLRSGQSLTYGLGFFLGACGPYREIGHDGTSGGFSAQAAYYPEAELSVVVLMNCERHDAERLEKQISRHVLGIEEPRIEVAQILVSDLAKYVGTYMYKGLEVCVEVRDCNLTVSVPNRRALQILYQGADTFIQSDEPSMRFQFTVYSTRADSFVVFREGKAIANARRLS